MNLDKNLVLNDSNHRIDDDESVLGRNDFFKTFRTDRKEWYKIQKVVSKTRLNELERKRLEYVRMWFNGLFWVYFIM